MRAPANQALGHESVLSLLRSWTLHPITQSHDWTLGMKFVTTKQPFYSTKVDPQCGGGVRVDHHRAPRRIPDEAYFHGFDRAWTNIR